MTATVNLVLYRQGVCAESLIIRLPKSKSNILVGFSSFRFRWLASRTLIRHLIGSGSGCCPEWISYMYIIQDAVCFIWERYLTRTSASIPGPCYKPRQAPTQFSFYIIRPKGEGDTGGFFRLIVYIWILLYFFLFWFIFLALLHIITNRWRALVWFFSDSSSLQQMTCGIVIYIYKYTTWIYLHCLGIGYLERVQHPTRWPWIIVGSLLYLARLCVV
jgi:hypothetical protein